VAKKKELLKLRELLCASSETTRTSAPHRASDTTYRGPARRISCSAWLCWVSAACNVDHPGNQRTCVPVGPATEFDGLMLTGPRTGCSETRCAGVATRRPCIATQLAGRVNKRVPFKHSPVLRLIAHQAKPIRTTAPRLAAHPLSRQVPSFARYSSTEQGSSAQMDGSGQGPVLKVSVGANTHSLLVLGCNCALCSSGCGATGWWSQSCGGFAEIWHEPHARGAGHPHHQGCTYPIQVYHAAR